MFRETFEGCVVLQDVQKAKAFLPFLQRAGRMEGVVEFVASGSRLRVYIPRETCLITFLLSGLCCHPSLSLARSLSPVSFSLRMHVCRSV